MNIGICDDLWEDRNHLKSLLLSYTSEFIVSEYTSGEELLAGLRRGDRVDLLFMDIYMGELNGMETAKALRKTNRELPIIFLTTSPDFAVASYRVQAQDYLLKPVNPEELRQALERQLQALAQQESSIPFHTAHSVMQIPISQILYVEAVARSLRLVQVDGTILESRSTIQSLEELLCKHPQFVRPHRSYLLNLHHVQQMDRDGFTTVTGVHIPIARGNTTRMKSLYLSQMLDK